MEKRPFFLNHKNNIIILAAIVLAIAVALFSPPEKTLGNIAKFIYLHGALSWVGILVFTLAGLLGAAFMLFKRYNIFVYSRAFEKTAILLWFIHFLMGIASMQIAWGGIFWQEPRFLTAALILLASVALYTTAHLTDKFLISAGLYFANAVVVWILLSNTERVFHPANPIMGGRSLNIKLYAGIITIFLFIAALGIAQNFKQQMVAHSELKK